MTEESTTIPTERDGAAQVRRLAALRAVAEIELARLLPAFVGGASLVSALGGVPLPVPEAKELLRRGEHAKPVREGFSGADPYEIALRFAAGLLSREQLVDELSRWEYTPDRLPPQEHDDSVIRGDWSHVEAASFDQLIDPTIYAEVLERTQERQQA